MKEDEVFSQDSVRKEILNQVKEIGTFLIEKNRKYGNSAIQPTRIFSKASDEVPFIFFLISFILLEDDLSNTASGELNASGPLFVVSSIPFNELRVLLTL